MKRVLRVVLTQILLVAAIVTVSLAVAASEASAAAGPYSVVGSGSNGLNVRSSPSTSASIVSHLANGATLYINCQVRGGTYATTGSPSTESIWDQLTSGGYVADWWVSTPAVAAFSPGIPQCGSSSPAPAPQPTPQPSGTAAELRNLASVRCLDANAQQIGGNGTSVTLYDCWGGANQNWVIGLDGTIRNQVSGRCLDADLNTIHSYGTIVHLWDCNGGANQRWIMNPDGTIHNAYNNWCLDADGGTILGNGTKVQLWGCNQGRNQSWYQKPAYTVPYSAADNYCVPNVQPLFGNTGFNFTPCVNVGYVYDETASAIRSEQTSGCPANSGSIPNSVTFTCSNAGNRSDWSATHSRQ